MKLKNSNLEEWLRKPPKKALSKPGDSTPFYEHYISLKNNLLGQHEETTKAAILNDIRNEIRDFYSGKKKKRKHNFDIESIIWLNDHGPKHVATVIDRASRLLNCSTIDLNAREAYILLVAIQMHDIGNFYGRINHEKKVLDVIKNLISPAAFDATETSYIQKIAQVHGGKVRYKDGSEDLNTIGTIKEIVTSDGYEIRQRFLAAILRFADEIADERSRADVKLLEGNSIPHASEVFHAYAACLDTVLVKHDTKSIEFHFKVRKSFIIKKFGKKDSDVFLLDEIYLRALKTQAELGYCSKFWAGSINLQKIWVQIEFFADQKEPGELDEASLFVHSDITFTLDDCNYPNIINDIFKLCPNLKYHDGREIDGANLLKTIQANENEPF